MIYFLQAPSLGFMKIGSSINLADRIRQIQGDCPVDLELFGVITDYLQPKLVLERSIQTGFEHWHIRGEWFRYDDQLLNEISFLEGFKRASITTSAGLETRGKHRTHKGNRMGRPRSAIRIMIENQFVEVVN